MLSCTPFSFRHPTSDEALASAIEGRAWHAPFCIAPDSRGKREFPTVDDAPARSQERHASARTAGEAAADGSGPFTRAAGVAQPGI